MSGVFNLGAIFELIDDGFNQRSFVQQDFVGPWQELIFHVGTQLGNQLKGALLSQAFGQLVGDVASVSDQLAKEGLHQPGPGFSIINVAGGERHVEQWASMVDDQMELEAKKPSRRTFTPLGELGKDPVLVPTSRLADGQRRRVDKRNTCAGALAGA